MHLSDTKKQTKTYILRVSELSKNVKVQSFTSFSCSPFRKKFVPAGLEIKVDVSKRHF